MKVLTISESVPELSASAAASGPSAATPCPHGPSSGVRGGAVGGPAVPARPLVGRAGRAGPQLGHGRVVALDEAVEAPLPLEDVRLQLTVAAPGHAVDGVEREHRRARPGV